MFFFLLTLEDLSTCIHANAHLFFTGVSKMAFRHLIEFTYTAKLMIQGEEEANDVWKAAEFLQMLEAIKALEVR